MPLKFLGKKMFPRLPAWQARRQVRHIMAAIVVALAFGVIIFLVMYLQNAHR